MVEKGAGSCSGACDKVFSYLFLVVACRITINRTFINAKKLTKANSISRDLFYFILLCYLTALLVSRIYSIGW
jgi:hypothetical protein